MSPAHRGSLFSFAVRAVSGTAANLHLKQFHRDIVLTGYQDPVVFVVQGFLYQDKGRVLGQQVWWR